MASNASSPRGGDSENSLEKIKRQLSSNSGRNFLQGPLLKRSETLRKWNERWVILDPTTGKMEYKTRRNESIVKGTITFDANSTISLSPVNFQATQLVLKAHKEAVDSLSGNGSAKLGTVAAVVAAANSMALESTKEIEAAMKISMRTALGMVTNRTTESPMDDLAIMKDQGFQGGSRNGDTWEKVGRIRDKFEYDKERRMSEKAFDPMNRGESDSRIQPFDAHKYFPESESDRTETTGKNAESSWRLKSVVAPP
ncbi:hypothetical protein IFM89_026580 [Coptis chinensis]|uniref:PH domain-containing protein n=1 Tax=Coptis chinensis TaxID=261450 RepID=A0A835IS52_9MAGN|nr:hypothetical protein IFM89_026580 [Coptis chinensis]